MENIGKAFTFVFDDEKWVNKILMGSLFSLLSIILIGIPFILGYMLETLRNVADGKERPLPEWDNLGQKFTQGLLYAIVTFVYTLPATVIYTCSIVAAAALSPSNPRGGENALSALGAILASGGMCFLFLYILGFYILLPAITIRFAMTGSFGEAFRFRDHIRFLRENLGNYVLVILLALVASIIGQLGAIACFIGVFVTMFYSYLVMAYLFGQLYSSTTTRPA